MARKLLQSFRDKRIHYVDIFDYEKAATGGDGFEKNKK